MPREKSGGVENAFATVAVPSASNTTQSVHVPPISMATTNLFTA
jgi:hypothetical protein